MSQLVTAKENMMKNIPCSVSNGGTSKHIQGKNLTRFDKVLIISIIIESLMTHNAEEEDHMAKEEEGPFYCYLL